MTWRALLGVAALWTLSGAKAEGQERRTRADSVRADSIKRAVADSVRADSVRRAFADSIRGPVAPGDTVRAKADSIRKQLIGREAVAAKIDVQWAPPDSVMQALMAKRGYSITRYQGDSVTFGAENRTMTLQGRRAIVERDSATIIGDTIQFSDSTQIVIARGDTVVLRTTTQGQDDIVALGRITYDVPNRKAVVRDVTTVVESGQRWIVHGQVAAFKGDSTGQGNSTFFAKNGWITSCEDETPHYHFAGSEMKMISKRLMIIRPAVLYIGDVPVMWIPFVLNDLRPGQRSGLLTPELGLNQIFRSGPFQQRFVNNIGYQLVLNDYVHTQFSLDWRSNARTESSNPGSVRINGRADYAWKSRFVTGSLGYSQNYQRNGSTNQEYSWRHSQSFSQRTSLTADVNYTSNTSIQRQTTFNPYVALGTIRSALNYSTGRGPFSLNVGGNQTQYPGREQVERTFPTLSITSKPIAAGEWLTWTPSLNISNRETLKSDQVADFSFRYIQKPGGGLDSVRLRRDDRQTTIGFNTPLEIFGFNWSNDFQLTESARDFPERRVIYRDPNDSTTKETRIFARTFQTGVNWTTSFQLPGLLRDSWNLQPSVAIQKVDGRSPLIVRTERTGGQFVAQSLRPAVGLGISPKFYGFLPGFGPIEQIRHVIEPRLNYQWTPRGHVSDEFLSANGDLAQGFLGNNVQNIVSLALNTSFEAKLRVPLDTSALGDSAVTLSAAPEGQKVKLLSLSFTTLSYDFVRAQKSKSGIGLTNTTFDINGQSDLIPGLSLGTTFSLFQGDPMSDTAVFQPYREGIRAQMSFDAKSPVVGFLARLLHLPKPLPEPTRAAGDDRQAEEQRVGGLGVPRGQGFQAGRSLGAQGSGLQMNSDQPWRLDLEYSGSRQRPPTGDFVNVDPRTTCEPFINDVFDYQACLSQNQISGTNSNGNVSTETTRGGSFFRTPPQQSVNGSIQFKFTERWGAQWRTSYDFTTKDFAQHVASLTREMHDWDAVFAFTKAPNGNFAFNFYVALRAQPDLRLPYTRSSAPRGLGRGR